MRTALIDQGLTSTRVRLGDRFLAFLALCLVGYSLGGRGFAYVGYPPLYIGEVCLAMGLIAWAMTRGWSRMLNMPPVLAVLPLVTLGALRLLPCIPEWGIDAMRDAVIWGYSAFALFVACLIIAKPERLPKLIEQYRLFTRIFLIGIPIVFVIYRFGREALPVWPWGGGPPIIQEKEGDVLVHLSGILAFWMADPKRKVNWFWAALLTLDMALMGVIDRAGLLSFGAVLILCLICKPFHGAAWRTIGLALCGVLLLWASAINIEVPGGKGRSISWDSYSANIQSMFGYTHNDGLDSTKEWRLDWWAKIYDYTVDGPYFWQGKGFGVNLADDDGFQVNADKTLRSPHSIHMNILARMGVPGMVLWIVMHLVWLYSIGDAYLRARRRKHENWAGLFLFLFSFYVAFMINGSFDVFIEGPMGGVWFWTIYGTGVGGLWLYKRSPQVLMDPPSQGGDGDENSDRAQLLPAAGWRRPGLRIGAGAARVART